MTEPELNPAAQDERPRDAIEFVDAATRVAKPSAFDEWYYAIEDRLGQGTVGMGVCLLVFMVILIIAMIVSPI